MSLKDRLRRLQQALTARPTFTDDPSALPVIVTPDGYQLYCLFFEDEQQLPPGRYRRMYGLAVDFDVFESINHGSDVHQRWILAIERMKAMGATYES